MTAMDRRHSFSPARIGMSRAGAAPTDLVQAGGEPGSAAVGAGAPRRLPDRSPVVAILALVVLPTLAAGQGTPVLVRDINRVQVGMPEALTRFAGATYFRVNSGSATGLWRTDGTAAGTVRIHAGHADVPTAAGDHLFFVVSGSDTEGSTLWATDGSGAPAPLRTHELGAAAGELTEVNGALAFGVTKSDTSWELWKSDGTAQGTVRVKEIAAPASLPHSLTSVGDTLYFVSGGDNEALWKSNGTGVTTSIVYSGTGPYPAILDLTPVGATLFFVARGAADTYELWRTTGSDAIRLVQFPAGTEVGQLLEAGDKLYFTTVATGPRLWRSDGTALGTAALAHPFASIFAVADAGGGTVLVQGEDGDGPGLWLSDGTDAGTHRLAGLTPVDSTNVRRLGETSFFTADDGGGPGLWRTDGSVGGTALLAHLSVDSRFAAAGGAVYFAVRDDETSASLWRSDATTVGTAPVLGGFTSSLLSLEAIDADGALHFIADDGVAGSEIWRSDGSETGTALVADVVHETAGAVVVPRFYDVDGRAFFFADDGISGGELWRSDGTDAGTVGVKDIRAGSASSALPLVPFLAIDHSLFFWANDGGSGPELWRTDGSSEGTAQVRDLNPGPGSSIPFVGFFRTYFTIAGALDGTLVYFGNDEVSTGLVRSDGTPLGTRRIGPPLRVSGTLVPLGRNLFFSASDGLGGAELWKTDGSDAGTVRVADIVAGPVSSEPVLLQAAHGELFFQARTSTTGRQLWKTDGSEAGTVPLTGDGDESPTTALTDVNGLLYFGAAADSHGSLWKTDGTPAGTVRIGDLGGLPAVLVDANGILLVTVQTGGIAPRIWRSDGTAAGTGPLEEVAPEFDPAFALLTSPVRYLGAAHFLVRGEGMVQLWRSDGTATGTARVKEIAATPGTAQLFIHLRGLLFFSIDGTLWSSDGTESGTRPLGEFPGMPPGALTASGARILFSADAGGTGAEPWAIPAWCGGDCNRDGSLAGDDLATAVTVALGGVSATACPPLDTEGDLRLSVDDVVRAVNEKLNSCS